MTALSSVSNRQYIRLLICIKALSYLDVQNKEMTVENIRAIEFF